jgi:hypothetical protein
VYALVVPPQERIGRKSVKITLERTRLARLAFWSQFLANTRQRAVGGARASRPHSARAA